MPRPEPIPTSQPELDSNQVMSENVDPVGITQPETNNDITKGNMNFSDFSPVAGVLIVVALLAGSGTGFGLHKLQARSGGGSSIGNKQLEQTPTSTISNGDVFGVQDESTFKDNATGYLEAGGIEGEGSHKLLRPGGDNKTVYLTSSITDMDEFVGMEIKVWGETFKAQKAGWLMDVGRVEVVKVKGEAPVED